MENSKTNRKNKTNLVVKWPETNSYFSLMDLKAANPDFIEITLRSRINSAIEDKKLVIIGTRHATHGRPVMIMAMTPVSQELINKAEKDGITIVDKEDLLEIMKITPTVSVSEPVKPVVPTEVKNTPTDKSVA